MSAFERSWWKDGFPFSASLIRAGRRLQADDINVPSILDAPPPSSFPPAVSPAPAQESLVPAAMRPARQGGRPIGRQNGLRLLPLEAFVWGSQSKPPQPRTRPDHVLIWVTEGHVHLDFPREHLRLCAGDLRYIPAGTAFAAAAAEGTRGHVLLLSAPLALQAAPPLPDRVLAAQVGSHAAQLEATLREIGIETPDSGAGTLSCLMNLLSLRLRQLAPARVQDAPAPGLPDRPLIERFMALARERLGEARSVAELAAELGSTTLLLDHACLAAHGKRAVEMIHDLRLECAARMLRETARPTQRIAAELGYSSHAHFTRAFVSATGRTPEAFRVQSC
ncbi:helix-turn-helix domain-containing protein [Paracoccus benzoatiresistens]|uniref:AraC family transcriptional regulator n=1 Tax=Paracoccus benzoatiresistens TaxID=2997341 RepID=A0ABT4J3S2_9RHOB|nr:AraC family transcriptional regulator [Paracoccus sp. EF6]MCZ0961777.1 AraC family transcriptional regulator [Paracoccus sp. EF6]